MEYAQATRGRVSFGSAGMKDVVGRSHPVIERRRAEREALIHRARTWVRELRRTLRIERAVVFGSVARGDFNRWSDVDLLIVSDDFAGPPLRRLEQLGDRPPRVEPLCWTNAEWHLQQQRGNPITAEVEALGVDVE